MSVDQAGVDPSLWFRHCRQGNLRHISRLKFWSVDDILVEKYDWDQVAATNSLPPRVVRDANMGHQLAGGNRSWCPELESWTTHLASSHCQ